jgi:hypothetical protein
MNWRRGLLLAGIHLAIAVSLILWVEERELRFARPDSAASLASSLRVAHQSTGAQKDDDDFVIDPCTMIVDYPVQKRLLHFDNYPALAVAGWQLACPPNWSVARRLHIDYLWTPIRSELPVRKLLDQYFGGLIAMQWFLVGAFPLTRPHRWWLEPSAFITICTVIAFGLVSIPDVERLAEVPALLAGLSWLWWFALLLWKPVPMVWQSTLAAFRRLTN